MIRQIIGDNVTIRVGNEGVVIQAENQSLAIHDETWLELVKLIHLIRAAAREYD